MPTYCCVPGCKNSGGHRFPKDKELKMKWRVAIRRQDPRTKNLWSPKDTDVVCHCHFNEDAYRMTLSGDRSCLKYDAVPSIALGKQTSKPNYFSPRSERSTKRAKVQHALDTSIPDVNELGVQMEVEIDPASATNGCKEDTPTEHSDKYSQSVQCDLPQVYIYSIEHYINSPSSVKYYTGFVDYFMFMTFFHCLGPAAYELDYQCSLLSPQNQLFLVLMKLRQSKDDCELSMFFHISKSTVSRLVITWINFLYFQLKELDFWPSQKVIKDFMPHNFAAKFPNTRVILDATEVPIEKPSDVNAQSITWSSYKHKNTIKAMVGITPKGAVSYVSDAYGGSASDRMIIEKSELFHDKFEKGDSIMADRGIMVQDLFANHDVFVNTPSLLKGKSQLEPEQVVKDRRVASKRIHVERVIGLAKTYKILKTEIPHRKVPLGSRIIFICFALSNFRLSIVDKNA